MGFKGQTLKVIVTQSSKNNKTIPNKGKIRQRAVDIFRCCSRRQLDSEELGTGLVCLLVAFSPKEERNGGRNAPHCFCGDVTTQDYTSAGHANKQVKKDLQTERSKEGLRDKRGAKCFIVLGFQREIRDEITFVWLFLYPWLSFPQLRR